MLSPSSTTLVEHIEAPSSVSSDSDEPDIIQIPYTKEQTSGESGENLGEKNPKDGRFYCSSCTSSFGRKHDLKRHCEKNHETTIISSGDCLCLQCGQKFYKMEKLREHLTEQHGIDMKMDNLSFDSYADFEEWKYDWEEKNNCSYVRTCGELSTKNEGKVQHFKCNRSGKFKTSGVGKRRMKSSGTCKLQENCTSTIRVSVKETGKVDVSICTSHYGHELSMEHIRLNKRQRHGIAPKLAQGVALEKILDEIRDNVGMDFRKIHLLDRKDIGNIRNSYNIDSVKRHENDQQSVLSWIQEWEKEDYNPILYHKLQGQESDNPALKDEDFMIIIQTKAQRELYQKFGSNGVCADATHGTTGYEFLLSSLLVVDEFGHGQPVGWCLATHETEEFLKIFFDHIAENSSKVSPRWVMSDCASQ